MARILNLRLRRMQQVIRVHTVNYIHLVSGVTKRVRQTVDIHRISAETVGRIKGGEVAESKRASHSVNTFGIKLISCWAAASQESRLAAVIPASRRLLRRGSEVKTLASAASKS